MARKTKTGAKLSSTGKEEVKAVVATAAPVEGGCCTSGKGCSKTEEQIATEPVEVAGVASSIVEDAQDESCATSGYCAGEGDASNGDAPAMVEPVAAPCATGCCGLEEPLASAPTPVKESVGCCGPAAPSALETDDKPAASSCCSSTKKPAAEAATTAKTSSSCCSSTPSPAAKPVSPKRAKACCVKTPSGDSCCKPKPILVAPADKMTSCCAPKASCSASKSAKKPAANGSGGGCGSSSMSDRVQAYKTNREHRPTTKLVPSMRTSSVESMRLSIGGMTCSGCCTRIEGFLSEQPGIVGVNVSLLTSRGVFEYDPNAVTPAAIEKMVTTLGFSAAPMPNESLATVVLHIGRELPSRAKQSLLAIEGVASVRDNTDDQQLSSTGKNSDDAAVVVQNNSVLVDYDPDVLGARTLVARLSSAMGGAQVQASTPRPHALASEEQEVATFARYLFWSCVLSLPVLFVQYIVPLLGVDLQRAVASEIVDGLSWQNLVGFVCATPILLFIAYPIHESAVSALRFGSRVTMDVLISLSSFSAYLFSVVTVVLRVVHATPRASESFYDETFFEVTAMLISLILLGRYIEKLAKAKASHSVDALLQIQAKTAILLETDSDKTRESYIDVLLVERGDLLKVLPGARVPTDGVVVEGASSVDESMVTGESRKVAKEIGSVVIGGTINAQGVLVMRVTHTINESMLARIVSLVDEAQSSKCVSQSVADVVSSYFTTFIITVALVMFVVWYELAARHHIDTHGWAPLPFALRFAITILVISCPCAISLAVPTAIMVATTIGSQFGVLFKGGQALEALDAVDVVIFDKTGTLTTGKLQVVDFLVASTSSGSLHQPPALTARQLWTYFAAAERNSEHAIARAVLQYATKIHTSQLEATAFESVPGCGVRCSVDGRVVCAGSLKWMLDVLRVDVPLDLAARNQEYQRDGCVVVCLAIDNALVALVAMQDTPRAEAKLVVEQLRQRKIQTWIVTGDQRETALSVATQLGIPHVTVIADSLPHQKVDKVRLLQGIGKRVAFIGDGVNDGPALAMAHVGVAIGAGTDVAIEAADLVLVKDDLRDFLNALDLSRATNRLIRWNFTWGFMYNLLMMPLACGALYPFFGLVIPPAFAGLSELFSSVPVILFSLLLNLWTPPFKPRKNDDSGNDLSNYDGSEKSFVAIDIKKEDEKTPLLAK